MTRLGYGGDSTDYGFHLTARLPSEERGCPAKFSGDRAPFQDLMGKLVALCTGFRCRITFEVARRHLAEDGEWITPLQFQEAMIRAEEAVKKIPVLKRIKKEEEE